MATRTKTSPCSRSPIRPSIAARRGQRAQTVGRNKKPPAPGEADGNWNRLERERRQAMTSETSTGFTGGTCCLVDAPQVSLEVVPSPSIGGVAGGGVIGSLEGGAIGSVGGGMLGSVGGVIGSAGGFMGSVAGSIGGVAGSFIGAGSIGGASAGGGSLLHAVNANAMAAARGRAIRRIGELLQGC
ncbi:hypothetical protein [Luteimonas sp. 9C]|uniref:hypothetical protein n=1 Tax=Luteimonas sp. 9C TaxID=2653148 RepID=UPI0019165702|nr:hypothetical protein [Luteimonas sp. 9C]